jgi:peptidoglycan hydrolase-like protein with peptidoglycan-binding domain
MAVKLPYRSESQVDLPQVVRSYGNGKIPGQLLVSCGIRNFKMVEPAARACRAMVTAAAAEGVLLDATGTYRSYEQQESLFKQRYTKSPQSGRRTKTWNGVTYWQKPGVAMAATPGTSKHGLGVTPDLAQRSAAGKLESVGTNTLQWLAAHGPSFGFWNSVKSEAWHWPYFPGDDIPGVVLDMEGNGMVRLQPAVPLDPKRREAYYKTLPLDGVLSKGSRGPGVEAVQWALTRAGIPAGIDGDFGPGTERAVKEFQAASKLTVDGLVGSMTWAKLGLLSDDKRPQEDVTPPVTKKAAAKKTPAKKTPAKKAAAKRRSVYEVTADDADGFIAVVARCVGITEAPWSLRSTAATAVAEHNGVALDKVWQPGNSIRFPATIDGVRTYTVAAGDGMIAITKGLGLGRSAAAQDLVATTNAWHSATPHAGDTWYGGAA